MSPITEQSDEMGSSVESFDPKAQKLLRINNQKRNIMNQLGGDKYKKVHDYLTTARKKEINDSLIFQHIKKIVGDDKAALSLATNLDQLVFMELQYQQ